MRGRRGARTTQCGQVPAWSAYWALSGGFLVHVQTRWCNGCGLLPTCAWDIGGFDLTAIAASQVVPA